ncbi:MAG: AraC family transcriptional regulator [Dysgonamonadaceae bacterium]|jgi:AraC-like DNA-binding protein|nr:AraC family transcriptional regulator [Dysgonamonadaceae bacterium]
MKLTTRFFIQILLCLFTCFISTIAIWGQSNDFQHQKDSLLKVITSTKGEEKLKTYETLARLQFPDEETDLMLQYVSEFIREARKQQNKKYESKACKAELVCLWNYLKHDEFERKANEYLPFIKKNGTRKDYYDVYTLQIQLSGRNGNNKRSIEGAKQMYEEAKQENCLYGVAHATNLMARIYTMEERYDEAEKYFRETIQNALKLIKEESDLANYFLASTGYNGLVTILNNQGKINECLSLMPIWKKHAIAFEKTFGYPDPFLVYYYKCCACICIDNKKYDEAELYCDSMEPMIIPIELHYIWDIKFRICEERNEYDNAIKWLDKDIDECSNLGEFSYMVILLKKKAHILRKMRRTEESYSVFETAVQLSDSIRLAENNAQLDEIRTQYEVDKHIAREEYLHNYLLFAIGSCILLAIALGGWMHYSRKITKKNRTLAQQIKELTIQQEELINEMLTKTSFSPHFLNETTSVADNNLCVESRMDKLCIAVRDLLLKDKIYRNPALTQELVIESLGTNRRAFTEAFEHCLKMQFKDYVNFLRLKDAIQLLEQSDLSIEEISEIAGFGTVQTFRNQFRDKYNMAPKDYRNSIKTPSSSFRA